jgi:hypothetical protein
MRPLLLFIASLNLMTGVVIFFAPQFFYDTVPGVSMMGPFNLHFIRDAGLAYFGSGLLLGLAWRREEYAFALGGALWPCLHALFHIQIWLARGALVDQVAITNLFGIQLSAWAALLAAWTLWRNEK